MAIDFLRPSENLSTAVTLACFKIEGNLPFFMVSLTKLQIQDEKVTAFSFKTFTEMSVLCAAMVQLFVDLRICTGKNFRQIKLQRLQKARIWAFRLLLHQINSL